MPAHRHGSPACPRGPAVHLLPTRFAKDESRSLARSFPPGCGGMPGARLCVGTVGFRRSPACQPVPGEWDSADTLKAPRLTKQVHTSRKEPSLSESFRLRHAGTESGVPARVSVPAPEHQTGGHGGSKAALAQETPATAERQTARREALPAYPAKRPTRDDKNSMYSPAMRRSAGRPRGHAGRGAERHRSR